MGQFTTDQAVASNLTNVITPYEVAPSSTDSPTNQKESIYDNEKFRDYFGFYKDIPELRVVIDTIARWTVGKGLIADEETIMLLDTIEGCGGDTFNTILENLIRTYQINGDAYAEIIRDDDGILINLKPLTPQDLRIVANRKGIIEKYLQLDKTDKNNPKVIHEILPDRMLHLMRNRVTDEFHGHSLIESLEFIIKARNEAMTGYKQVIQRFMKPRYIFHLATENTTEIAEFKTKMDKAWNDGENIYVAKDTIVPEVMSIAPNASMNPITWIRELNNYFFQAAGLPQIIVGNAAEFTDASAKISYLSFQQMIKEEQLFIEQMILKKLNLVIDLVFPASLEAGLLSDEKKDGELKAAQPNDTTAGEVQ